MKKYKYISGFVIHLASFIIAVTAKRGGLYYQEGDIVFIILIMGVSFIFALLFEKYSTRHKIITAEIRAKNYFYSFLLSLGTISLIINISFSQNVSRFIVFGSLFLSFIIEIALLLLKNEIKIKDYLKFKIDYSIANFVFENAVFGLVFFMILTFFNYRMPVFRRYPFIYTSSYFIWLVISVLIHNFGSVRQARNYWAFIWARIKTYVIYIAVMSLILFMYSVEQSMLKGLTSFMLLYSITSFAFITVMYIAFYPSNGKQLKRSFSVIVKYKEDIKLSVESLQAKYVSSDENFSDTSLKEQLINVYLKKFPGIYEFLDETLDINTFDFRKSAMMRSSDLYNIEILPENYLEFFLNLHELNDIGNINDYLLQVNKRIVTGGYFVGRVEPVHLRFERFLRKYPYNLARAFYSFDFIWRRVLPNMPFLRKIYFLFSNRKKKVLSFPEALGRLYYCGFEICNYKQFGSFIYYICRKTSDREEIDDPVYGPLIKLKRIGKEGKIINVYKFRTMHPYAEHIQKFIYEKNKLEQGGKIKDDFRVTGWGKILRKYWIDEFPMFINFFKGDLKLVGVRPLSSHYLSLYDDELKAMRTKYKPGILPPFYYDMPRTIAEIMNSEKKYLTAYSRHPFLTDVKYFAVILYNILLKKARSK